MLCSTCLLRSAITALAPCWPRRACSVWLSARTVHNAARMSNSVRQWPTVRVAGSVMMPATRWPRSTAVPMAQAAITTPQRTEAST